MQRQLKCKLEKIEKDQLIEIIETFCNVNEDLAINDYDYDFH